MGRIAVVEDFPCLEGFPSALGAETLMTFDGGRLTPDVTRVSLELVASFPEHRDGAPWPQEKVTASSQRAARRKREGTLRQRVAQAGAERRVFCSVHCGLPILTVLVFLTKFQ